jgi:hypothetical protein
MKPWKIIQKLEATSSRLEKEEILKSNWHNVDFKTGLKLALDPMTTFGIKQIPEKVGGESWPDLHYQVNGWDVQQTGDTLLTIHDFVACCDHFSKRELTGNNAKDAVAGMIARCESVDEWNYWYRRILLKDLKCGISEKTVNKVYGKGFIPIFGCMLAKDIAGKDLRKPQDPGVVQGRKGQPMFNAYANKLKGKKQQTINIEKFLQQGLESDQVEELISKRLNELDELVVSIEFVLNVQSIADTVQPATDEFLRNL